MKKIKLFLFDLDGTLIDSKLDIANSVNHTMKVLGLSPLPNELIYDFVGNGVTPLIRKSVEAHGVHSFDRAMEIFMAHYDQHLLDSTRLFPGMEDVLRKFQNTPKIIVTNKSQGFSDKIAKGLDLMPHFEGLFGGDTEFPKKPDPAVVRHLLDRFQVPPEETVIIGDSRVDIETGKNSGILTCGVTWGFRPRSELEESQCDWIAESPRDILTQFC